jgi:hypothetical protein
MKPLLFDKRRDPVSRMVRSLTAEEIVDWLVEYHGLPPNSASTVKTNLREQLKWQRLQGRLDRLPVVAVIAKLLRLRSSVKRLERQEGGGA